jgi:uncharacterized membrane protein YtjA (UPF0391 family)
MLIISIIFLVLAGLASIIGFTNIARTLKRAGKILFVIFLALFAAGIILDILEVVEF